MKQNALLLPLLIGFTLSLVFGLVTGYGRLLVWFFLPGLQGILFGAVLGYTVGAVLSGKGRSLPCFSLRLALAASMVAVFCSGQVIVSAFVLEGWDPLFLPVAILDGHFREVMTGASINSYTVQQGPLTPGWWIFFQLIDTGLFVFSWLICLGVGLDKKRTRYRIWKPSFIVGALLMLVLLTTSSTQSFTSGLLRDWQTTYGGGMAYLEWREE